MLETYIWNLTVVNCFQVHLSVVNLHVVCQVVSRSRSLINNYKKSANKKQWESEAGILLAWSSACPIILESNVSSNLCSCSNLCTGTPSKWRSPHQSQSNRQKPYLHSMGMSPWLELHLLFLPEDLPSQWLDPAYQASCWFQYLPWTRLFGGIENIIKKLIN